MKKFSKVAVVAVMAIVVGCFASCKKGPGIVSSWWVRDGTKKMSIVFYNDDSFTITTIAEEEEAKLTAVMSGTYEGDASTDGTVTMKVSSVKARCELSAEYKTLLTMLGESVSDFENDMADEFKEDMEKEFKGESITCEISGDIMTTESGAQFKRK